MADRKTWIIAYDVTEPGRLVRVHKYLTGRAFPLQYSVFAADLGDAELAEIKKALRKLIDEKKDDVRLYAAPSGFDVLSFGAGALPQGVYVFGEGAAGLAGGISHADAGNADEEEEENGQ